MTKNQKLNDKLVQRVFKNGMDMRTVKRQEREYQAKLIKKHEPFNEANEKYGWSYCTTCGMTRKERFNPCIHGFSCCEYQDSDLQCRYDPKLLTKQPTTAINI